MFQGTIKSLAGKVQFGETVLDEGGVRALLTLGKAAGFAKEIGTVPSNGQRGRPQIVYTLNESLRAKLSAVGGKAPTPVEYIPAEAPAA